MRFLWKSLSLEFIFKIMRHFWYLLVLAILSGCNSNNQQTQTSIETDKTQILQVLKTQENAWNNRDFEGFMQGYLQSDSLKFYGRNGLTKGWQNTLTNYKKVILPRPKAAHFALKLMTYHLLKTAVTGLWANFSRTRGRKCQWHFYAHL